MYIRYISLLDVHNLKKVHFVRQITLGLNHSWLSPPGVGHGKGCDAPSRPLALVGWLSLLKNYNDIIGSAPIPGHRVNEFSLLPHSTGRTILYLQPINKLTAQW